MNRVNGQMGMQDVEVAGGDTTVTDYGLGARGIDSILTCVNGGQTTTAYPMYDAHGNMISTLTKVDGGGYSYSPLRTYDAWGLVRSGATTGDPKGRYCANLGHKQDDESGLIYMRARYYEPSSGRFVSEDPAMQGVNWFCYGGCDPIGSVDDSGKWGVKAELKLSAILAAFCFVLDVFGDIGVGISFGEHGWHVGWDWDAGGGVGCGFGGVIGVGVGVGTGEFYGDAGGWSGNAHGFVACGLEGAGGSVDCSWGALDAAMGFYGVGLGLGLFFGAQYGESHQLL